VPLQVSRVDGVMGEVSLGGVTRRANLVLTPGAAVGDWVLVHTGFAIAILDPQEAEEILALFGEIAAAGEAESSVAGAAP
jgi:hydrogenase expression/formation protein HypC